MDPRHLHHHVTHPKSLTYASFMNHATHTIFLTYAKILQTHATHELTHPRYPRHPRNLGDSWKPKPELLIYFIKRGLIKIQTLKDTSQFFKNFWILISSHVYTQFPWWQIWLWFERNGWKFFMTSLQGNVH